MDSIEDAHKSLTTLPYLTVLLARRPESNPLEPHSHQEMFRIRGLGFLTQTNVLISAAYLAQDADTAVVLGEPDEKKHTIQALPQANPAFASFTLSPPAEVIVAPHLNTPLADQECVIAVVDDDRLDVRLMVGRIAGITPTGEFRVDLENELAEYRSAVGSPVIADGMLVGIVGTTATNSSVDAMTLPDLIMVPAK